jgi:hypothetical protein
MEYEQTWVKYAFGLILVEGELIPEYQQLSRILRVIRPNTPKPDDYWRAATFDMDPPLYKACIKVFVKVQKNGSLTGGAMAGQVRG